MLRCEARHGERSRKRDDEREPNLTAFLNTMTASEAAARIAARELQSESLVRACLERISDREPSLRAWAHIDTDAALSAAREADKACLSNARPLGPLHGVPIGIKDVISTVGLRTEYNSEIYRGQYASADASAVMIMRRAGAIVLGKTETVEFAAAGGRVALTSNPHDLLRTPGGSSSGSAAAVADFMVPLTLGTQTGGSIIRPASYCGVVGFKPTYGTVSTEGVKLYANTLDTVGWFARSVEDIVLVVRIFEVSDEQIPPPTRPAASLHIGFCRTPYWDAALPATRSAMQEAIRRLSNAGASVTDLDLGTDFSDGNNLRETIMLAEGRFSFLNLHQTVPDKISSGIRKRMDRINNALLCAALDRAAALRSTFDALASDFDAIIAPSAPGEAPTGLASTGYSIFNGLWTLLHVPCITLPGLTGAEGLPVGVQLIGSRYSDTKLLAAAQTVAELLRR
jgi:Asp-tRNA(Asn)/Glu-tRNA(Gln) amidotransferase A subunit family amidase